MIEKKLTEFLEVVADSMKTKVGDAVFPKNQGLDAVKALQLLDILVSDLRMRQIHLFSMGRNHQIPQSRCPWPTLRIMALHDYLELCQLPLLYSLHTLSYLFLFLSRSFCSRTS